MGYVCTKGLLNIHTHRKKITSIYIVHIYIYIYIYIYLGWIYPPPPSNLFQVLFRKLPTKNAIKTGGDCYWVGGRSNMSVHLDTRFTWISAALESLQSLQVAQMEFVSSLADAVKAKTDPILIMKNPTLQIESSFGSYLLLVKDFPLKKTFYKHNFHYYFVGLYS